MDTFIPRNTVSYEDVNVEAPPSPEDVNSMTFATQPSPETQVRTKTIEFFMSWLNEQQQALMDSDSLPAAQLISRWNIDDTRKKDFRSNKF